MSGLSKEYTMIGSNMNDYNLKEYLVSQEWLGAKNTQLVISDLSKEYSS